MAKQSALKQFLFEWEGRDAKRKVVRGEMRATSEAAVQSALRRQGVTPLRVKKRPMRRGRRIRSKDIALLTRQLAMMLKSGVPLLQVFDIIGRGNANPNMTKLLSDIRTDVETGLALSASFKKHPQHFDKLYCYLVEAGEAAGILDGLLERLATYLDKTEALKSKIKSALMYPIALLLVAAAVVFLMMIFVIPSFKDVFASFGAELPAPTMMVIAASDFFVKWWWMILIALAVGTYAMLRAWKTNDSFKRLIDRTLLKVPIYGPLVEKSSVARWSRTLATMFSAGVPLVEALDSVGGSSGHSVYADATTVIQRDIATGVSLSVAMERTKVFPPMLLQMAAIGEESGSLDHMLNKASDFYEAEADDMVAGLSSLMEPIILVVLGTMIGAIVVSMYLPIFKLGSVT